jgi:hypothetical protein
LPDISNYQSKSFVQFHFARSQKETMKPS